MACWALGIRMGGHNIINTVDLTSSLFHLHLAQQRYQLTVVAIIIYMNLSPNYNLAVIIELNLFQKNHTILCVRVTCFPA